MRGPVSYYDPDEVEPMVTAAVMYYQAHRSQAQIARHLGVSRPTVSRLLARARQLGIVRIEIVPPTADPGLGKDLQERLGLRGIHIAAGLADPDDPAPVLAGRLNDALAGIGLHPGDVLVVGWGEAIYSLGATSSPPARGSGRASAGRRRRRPALVPGERDHQALGGDPPRHPRYLHAPAFVSSALKRSLDHEEGVTPPRPLGPGQGRPGGHRRLPQARLQPRRRRLLRRRPGDPLTPRGTWSAASSPTMGR